MPDYTLTDFQNEVATRLGLDVSSDTYDVAAARIMDRVALAVKQFPSKPSSPAQRAFAKSLKLGVAKDTMRVASAKIADSLFEKNTRALARLKLKKDDRVIFTEKYETDDRTETHTSEHIVSSVGSNGRVYFKGIGCQGAWPTQLKRTRPNNSFKPNPLRGSA